jgi:hypothetical protein
MEETNLSISENRKRPLLLTALCIFTFLTSGTMALISLFGIFITSFLMENIKNMVPALEGMGSAFFIVMFLVIFILFALSVWGAILMFNLRKGGFVLYVIPNGLKLVFLIIFFLSTFDLYILFFLLVSIVLIILYSTQVRHMKG